MKKRIFLYSLLICWGLCFQSCLFSEEDLFDESSSARIQETIIEYEKLLQQPENGWLLEYYPGANYQMGGVNLLCKFDGKKVEIASEMGGNTIGAGKKVSSLYRVIAEQSVLLTIDTYNELIHLFGEPQGSNSSMQGDYEFVIMKASENEIVLQGKRYKNIMRMTPLDEVDWTNYITKLIRVPNQAFLRTYDLTVNGSKTGHIVRSGNTNTIEVHLNSADEKADVIPFIYTTQGLKLQKPLFLNGKELIHFSWQPTNDDAGVFVCDDKGAEDVKFEAYYPEGYHYYNFFLGDYTAVCYQPDGLDENDNLKFVEAKVQVKLEREIENNSYRLIGMPDMGTVGLIITYDRALGALVIQTPKNVASVSGRVFYQTLCLNNGYLPSYYGVSCQLDGLIQSENPLQITFRDLGYGLASFGQEFRGVVVDAYSSRLGGDTFLGWTAWFKDIVLTKKN